MISTGNEILHGVKADTNAAVISALLRSEGLEVSAHVTVGDSAESLARAVRETLKCADALVITGGLGPTDDDITISALKMLYGFEIAVHEPSHDRMRRFFDALGRQAGDADLKMVTVPSTATVIENRHGLAPGFILEAGGRMIVALPGVPREMELMLRHSVLPALKKRLGVYETETATLFIIGKKESEINSAVRSMGERLEGVTWGMTAEGGITSLYFTAGRGAAGTADRLAEQCRELFGVAALSGAHRTPEEEVLALLKQDGLTLAAAESCTGGLIAKRLTDIPGASAVFMGGVVAYSNRSKIDLLGVYEEKIIRHGAVSEEVAEEMARGIVAVMKSDIGISVTGIAGPDGGSEEKPVGTVCFGVHFAGEDAAWTMSFSGDRERVRRIAAVTAVDALRKKLLARRKQ